MIDQFALIEETFAGPFGHLPLARFLQANGTRWPGSPLPEGISRGPARHCFRNAWDLTLTRHLSYCEGYAWDSRIGAHPIHHAWNMCPSTGQVIDATWTRADDAVYLGIRMPRARFLEIIHRTGKFGVLDEMVDQAEASSMGNRVMTRCGSRFSLQSHKVWMGVED